MCLSVCIHTEFMYYISINTYSPTTYVSFIKSASGSCVQLVCNIRFQQIIYSGCSTGLAYSFPLLVWLDPQAILHSEVRNVYTEFIIDQQEC